MINNYHVSPFFWPAVKLLPLDLSGDLTDYEFLTKVCEKLNQIIDTLNTSDTQVEINRKNIELLKADVENIEGELEKVRNGDYVSLYLDSIMNYLNNNMEDIIRNTVKFVVFGISQDGHFCALVPKTWDFISWDTIMDYTSPLYGHLVMRW